MTLRHVFAGLVSLALVGGPVAGFAAAEDKDAKEEKEVKMSIKEVPAGVRKTLMREAFGENIKTVDKEELDGKTVYEADVVIDGVNYEIIVDVKGKLLSKKVDEEEDAKPAEKKEADEKPAKKMKKGNEDDEKSEKAGKAEKSENSEKKDKKAEKDDEDEKPAKKAKPAKDKEEKEEK